MLEAWITCFNMPHPSTNTVASRTHPKSHAWHACFLLLWSLIENRQMGNIPCQKHGGNVLLCFIFNQDISQWKTSSVNSMGSCSLVLQHSTKTLANGKHLLSQACIRYSMAQLTLTNLCAWKDNFPYGYWSSSIIYGTSCLYPKKPINISRSFWAADPSCDSILSCYLSASKVKLFSVTGHHCNCLRYKFFQLVSMLLSAKLQDSHLLLVPFIQ